MADEIHEGPCTQHTSAHILPYRPDQHPVRSQLAASSCLMHVFGGVDHRGELLLLQGWPYQGGCSLLGWSPTLLLGLEHSGPAVHCL